MAFVLTCNKFSRCVPDDMRFKLIKQLFAITGSAMSKDECSIFLCLASASFVITINCCYCVFSNIKLRVCVFPDFSPASASLSTQLDVSSRMHPILRPSKHVACHLARV